MKIYAVVLFFFTSLIISACVPNVTPPPASTTPAKTGAGVATGGWETEWNTLVEGARKEGQVLLYTSLGGTTIRPAIADAFKKKSGIDVDFMVGKGEEIVARIGNERRGGLYLADVVIIGAPSQINYLKPQGGLDNMKAALVLPEVTDTKSWLGNALPFVDEENKVFAFVAGYRTYITVNTAMVRPGEIKSYKDFLEPKWKGKLTLFDPTVGGSANQWMAGMMVHVYGPDESIKYFRELAKQEPVITRDGRLQMEWIAHGKYAVAIAARRENVSDFKAMGAPVDWVHPAEGGEISSGTGAMGLVNRPAHPNAARLFVNWLLSKEGQSIFVKVFGSPSARLDVPTEGLDPETVADPKRKMYMVDEKLYLQMPKAAEMAKEIFAASLR